MKIVSMIALLVVSASVHAADLDCSAKPVAFSKAQKLALSDLKALETQGYHLVAINRSHECPAVVELITYNAKAHAKATLAVYAAGAPLVSGPSITPYY